MIQEIIENFKARMRKYRRDRQRICELSEKIAAMRDELECPRWRDELVEPLAREMADRFGLSYEVMGPFGICARVPIYFEDSDGNTVAGLTLQPGNLDEGELYYETGETADRFEPGTMGEINGMNNVTERLPQDMDEIAEIFARRIEKYHNKE